MNKTSRIIAWETELYKNDGSIGIPSRTEVVQEVQYVDDAPPRIKVYIQRSKVRLELPSSGLAELIELLGNVHRSNQAVLLADEKEQYPL